MDFSLSKIIKFFLSSLIILSMLAGCSSVARNTTTTPAATATSASTIAIPTSETANSATQTVNTNTAPPDAPVGTPPNGTPPGAPPNGAPGGGPGGGPISVETGSGAYVLSEGEALTGGTYTSTKSDENAIRAEGSTTASLNGVTVEKTAGVASNNDASSFYGLNSAILALDNATLNINGGSVSASAEGANGIFAYDGATINITDTVINVTGGNAGGIEVAGGGSLNATNLTVNSTVKAAIRSDRGGGKLIVSGGSYTTSGSLGAPVISARQTSP